MSSFMKYDGVDSESRDADHDKWIDILAIDWGSHKPATGGRNQIDVMSWGWVEK